MTDDVKSQDDFLSQSGSLAQMGKMKVRIEGTGSNHYAEVKHTSMIFIMEEG